MRLAIAHDALVYAGGAERVVAGWLKRWPDAPLFTSAYLPNATFAEFRDADVRTSFVQRVAFSPHVVMRAVFPLMVPGFRRFDFNGYDVVLSSAAYSAKTIRVPRLTCHICYCYSPIRLAWRPQDYVAPHGQTVKRAALMGVAAVLRRWDFAVAQRVDAFATTCRNVAARIQDAYKREAEVIHAPIDCSRYRVAAQVEDYYLIVSRLNQYKRVDLAIRAATKLQRRLIVVGTGPEQASLARLADPRFVTFRGHVSDGELLDLYASCRAFLFPQEEDYGLTPLEAQASGRPVIAYRAGGALETVVHGETGWLFDRQDVSAVVDAMLEADRVDFDSVRIRQHAAGFDEAVFLDRLAAFVERTWQSFEPGARHG